MIITGEGHADRQTLMGKLPQKVLQRGQQMGVPVGLVAGRVDAKEQLLEAGFRFAESVTPDGMSTAEAMKKEVAHGDRMYIANATGCSSIWGNSSPSTPYTVTR